MKVYLVMQYHRDYRPEDGQWDVQGVFTDKQRAIEACHTHDFIYRELTLDTEYPLEQGLSDIWYQPTAGYARIDGKWVAQ